MSDRESLFHTLRRWLFGEPDGVFPALRCRAVYTCEDCGAGQPESHNRGCPHYWRGPTAAFVRDRLRELPAGKQALYMALDGVVVVVARDEAAHDLWETWFKPRAVDGYMAAVRRAASDPGPGHQHRRASDGEQA